MMKNMFFYWSLCVALPVCAQNLNGSFRDPVGRTHAALDIAQAPAPLFRDPVFDGAADPTVIWNEKTREWLIFYTQRRAVLDLKNVAFCYGTRIGIAASRDQGKTWSYTGTADLPMPDTGLNTFWAPDVFQDPADQQYHMFVVYIKGIHEDWGGLSHILHYRSKDLVHWEQEGSDVITDYIDPTVFQLKDGTWKLWVKYNRTSTTYSATSKDLKTWTFSDSAEVHNRAHEGPVVFFWHGSFWMITDPCYDNYTGLDVFRSVDATHWEYNNTILDKPGIRPDDIDQGRHADVRIVDGKAYIFYFTHPGRVYPHQGDEDPDDNRWRYRRSSLQVAELEYQDGKITCNRNKYALMQPAVEKVIPQ